MLRSKTLMLSSPRNPLWKRFRWRESLRFNPPRVVQQQLVEDAFEEDEVAGVAAPPPIDLEDAPGSPGVNRRVDVAERPLVRRELSVGVHVPFAG